MNDRFAIWAVRRIVVAFTALAMGLLPAMAVDVANLEVGQVGTSVFTASWTVSDPTSEPELRLFRDTELTQPVTEAVELEWAPLPQLEPDGLRSTYADRGRADEVRDAMRLRGRVVVRAGGLTPGTTYFVQAAALDAGDGSVLGESGAVAVTLAERTAMIRESRQLMLSLTALDPAVRDGALVRVSTTDAPYPLYGILINDGDSAQVAIDLTAFLDNSGTTQLIPAGLLPVTIELPDLPLDPLVQPVQYDGAFVVAAHTPVLYAGDQPGVAEFIFDPILDQNTGIPFSVTIRAVDDSGQPVTTFTEPVILDGSGPIAIGDGATPPFIAGILSGHVVRIDEAGPYQLSVEDAFGRTGTSNTFEVVQIFHTLYLNADPLDGGILTGAGQHEAGASVPITAVPNEGFSFVRWIGDGATDENAASTVVTMDQDRWLTAVFRSSLPISYETWSLEYFLRNAYVLAISDYDRDPDFDGIVNLLEFAFGRNPVYSDGDLNLPYLEKNGDGSMTYHYYRRRGHPNLVYDVMMSDRLNGGWAVHTPDPADVTIETIDDVMEKVSIKLTPGTQKYMSISVSL